MKRNHIWIPVAAILGLAVVAAATGDWWLVGFDLAVASVVAVGGHLLLQAEERVRAVQATAEKVKPTVALTENTDWRAHLADCAMCRDFWKADSP